MVEGGQDNDETTTSFPNQRYAKRDCYSTAATAVITAAVSGRCTYFKRCVKLHILLQGDSVRLTGGDF